MSEETRSGAALAMRVSTVAIDAVMDHVADLFGLTPKPEPETAKCEEAMTHINWLLANTGGWDEAREHVKALMNTIASLEADRDEDALPPDSTVPLAILSDVADGLEPIAPGDARRAREAIASLRRILTQTETRTDP